MMRLPALLATLSLTALAVPALAADPVPVHAACTAPAGAVVLTPGAKDDRDVTPPVGVLNESVVASEVGTFVLDLAGLPKTQKGSLTFTLAWDNPLADYDLITNGDNQLSTDNPEVKLVTASHCARVDVEVAVFLGLPVDAVTLSTSAR